MINIWRFFVLVVGARLLPLTAAGVGPDNKCTTDNADNPTPPTECGSNPCYEVTDNADGNLTGDGGKTGPGFYFFNYAYLDGYYQEVGVNTSSAEVGNFICGVGDLGATPYPWRYCTCTSASVNGD
eukprot:CAMPEP_0119372904 /NCGR_PEP_ID=MMETSP1334-20130426/23051_1 /TAXON_ID=127549 /ORGANISM="Calcidiscus leptoporus, Strain RCC1130" /LENGTH=125 /DNA_ID=CAMNT_0007390517 /DNA_START=53 /DNA_END=427 /DNA_ORIENTATION=+